MIPPLSEPVLGVDLYVPTNYSPAEVQFYGQRILPYIKNVLKADAVGIVWNFYASSRTSDSVKATKGTLSPSNVAILTRIAQQYHLQVEYRPLIFVVTQKDSWEGLIRPRDPVRWFGSYFERERPYLRVAQRLGVREFVTATEMKFLNSNPLWGTFYTRASQIYNGVISYATWDGQYFARHPHLQAITHLGMDMYLPIRLSSSATTGQVTAAWERDFSHISPGILQRTAIDETGIEARAGAYARPPDLRARGALSMRVQANWFLAACNTVKHYHMRGVFFWKVDLADNPAYPAKSLSTFEGREGAAAISECATFLH